MLCYIYISFNITSAVCWKAIILGMKKGRLFSVLVGGVFCLVVLLLYHMLDLMQGAELQRGGDGPSSQLDNVSNRRTQLWPLTLESIWQNMSNQICRQDLYHLRQKIDKLEHLLSNNNRLVATLRDSLMQQNTFNKEMGKANVSSESVDRMTGCRLTGGETDGPAQVSSTR